VEVPGADQGDPVGEAAVIVEVDGRLGPGVAHLLSQAA
jgi:hypothetical protein